MNEMGFLTFNKDKNAKVSMFKAVEKVSKEQFLEDMQLRKEQMSGQKYEPKAVVVNKKLLK